MKMNPLFSAFVLFAASLVPAMAGPADDVAAAGKKLGESANYGWKQTMDLGPNAQFKPGPTEGKTEKGGYTWLSSSFRDNTLEGVTKNKKTAVKTEDGWKTAEEATADAGGGGFNAGAMMARRLQNLKTPDAEIGDLVSKAKAIHKDGDVYTGDLTEEGAKSLLTMGFGRRGGQTPPPPTEAKGSLKFWLKDGAVTKYETKVSGKREFNGETRDIERTTTVEIKDVGTTKIELSDEAKKKLS